MTAETRTITWTDLDRRRRYVLDVTRRSKRALNRPDTEALKQLLSDLELYLAGHRSYPGARAYIGTLVAAHQETRAIGYDAAREIVSEVKKALDGCRPR